MKHLKKFIAAALTMFVALAMAVPAFAATNDGTITLTNATKGQTYEAYLVFKAAPSDSSNIGAGVSYTATPAQIAVSGFGDVFDTFKDADGNYTVTKKATVSDNDVITFVKNNIDILKQGDAISGTYSDNSTIVFSNLEYGYYYISSTLGSMVTIDTAAKSATVVDKNESSPEPPSKLITAEDSAIDADLDQADIEVEENDASVGSIESFKVSFNAVNWVQSTGSTGDKTQVTVYNFTDTPIGLDIDKNTVKVTVNGNDITSSIPAANIVKDADGKLSITIPWVDANGKSLYEAETEGSALIPVVITYDATVTADAATRTAPNEIDVRYNNDQELGTDTTTTYTYKFKLLKTDEKDQPLVGAEFELYYGDTADDTAPALTFTMVEEGLYRFDPNGTVTHIAPVGDNAEATIIGLDNASYMLREVVVPTGYNKAADQPVSGVTKETNATDGDSTVTPQPTTIKNLKGTELPSTGGMGTTILYIIGGILVVGGGIYLLTKKRMGKE